MTKREPYPNNDLTKCPECGSDDLAEFSPCEGVHHLNQNEPGGEVTASWSGHTDMDTGYICCQSCLAEWSTPDGVTFNYT